MTFASNPPIALTISLIVLFVVLFGLGIYWLLFRKGRQIPPSPTRPRATAWAPNSHAFDGEWEASAPYPDRALHAVQPSRVANQARHSVQADTPHPNHAARDECAYWDEVPPGTPPRDARDATSDDAQPTPDFRDAWESLQEALEPEPPASPPPPSRASAPVSQIRCPRCLSSRIDTRNLARKAGSTIGSVAGATGGMAAALAGAETGAVVGSIAGPLGTVFGGLAGAVIAGLVGSAAGCAAGSAVGGAIDDNVLDNHLCLACGHAFSVAQN